MFGMGMPEILLILAIALIVIGPKKLPDLAKGLGRALGEFKRATNELKSSIDIDPGLKDVKNAFDDMNADIKGAIHLKSPSENADKKKSNAAEAPEEKPSADTGAAAHGKAPNGGFDNLKQAFDKLNTRKEPTPNEDPTGGTGAQGQSDTGDLKSATGKSEGPTHGL